MRASRPDDDTHRLTAVLLPLLEAALAATGLDGSAASHEADRASRHGAPAILPAVLALRDLPGAVSGPWDGILHRRCSVRLLNEPRPQRQVGGREPNSGRGHDDEAGHAGPGRPVLAAVRRAGWELMRAETVIAIHGRTWLVRNELARRLAHAQHTSTRHADTQHSNALGAARAPGSHRGRAATTAAVGARPGQPEAAGMPVPVRLGLEDLQAWAGASGDHNALHLRAGAAAQAGLDAGPQEVIAHGLLLGALSLAQAPAWEYDLRFPAPLVVPAAVSERGLCLVDQGGCCADSERLPVLIRA